MEQGYLAQVQALIDQKWKENPEEMKRVMEEIEAKEKAKKEKPKVEPPKRVSFDPQLTQELIEELNKRRELDISKVKDLVMRGADIMAKNIHDDTALHQASWFNNVEIVKLLIERGQDVNAINKYGQTPLHWASGNNHIEIAELLLDRGADLEVEDVTGWTPLDRADSDEMRDLLKKYIK